MRWLFCGQAPLLVRGDGVWPLASLHDTDGETLLGPINLSLDPWPEAEFEIIKDAGHAASEPGILQALIKATDYFGQFPLSS